MPSLNHSPGRASSGLRQPSLYGAIVLIRKRHPSSKHFTDICWQTGIIIRFCWNKMLDCHLLDNENYKYTICSLLWMRCAHLRGGVLILGDVCSSWGTCAHLGGRVLMQCTTCTVIWETLAHTLSFFCLPCTDGTKLGPHQTLGKISC